MLAFALLSAAALSAQSQTLPCVETNGVKYVQPPNYLQGLDVWNSGPWMLADDFICTNSGPITDIHIWGSWVSNFVDANSLTFTLGIYDDAPVNATNNYSHPGNLKWQETFGPGQYGENPYLTGSESFLDPGPPAIIGTDNQAWSYCFYPTNPFVQIGTNTAPKIYWLAVYASLPATATGFKYGWKTTFFWQNDVSVHAPWPGSLPPSGGGWVPTTQTTAGGPLDLAFSLTTPTNSTPPTCCPETNGVKWVQGPDLITGIDYNASLPYTLADDFQCTNPGPITDIHLWGSWLNNQPDYGATYTLAIWSDVPTNVDITYSHPGTPLWTQPFGPGSYTICPNAIVAEPFNNPDGTAVGTTTNLYYLCFNMDPANAFTQMGTQSSPSNYWLSVTVQPSTTGGGQPFGWKSSTNIFNDKAVFSPVAFPPPFGSWIPINPGSPLKTRVDLAFKITTLPTTTNPPPVVCVESDYEKTVQWPNIIGGYDVWNTPYVLADDFVCTNSGPISDIHLWGSWLKDEAQPYNITFWLGIYDDVKVGPGNTFSHPGTNLLWQQWFAPGQYAETIWEASASEQFLDPGPTNILGGDSEVWYYCFYPTNAFQQLGTPTNSKTYWLAAYAQLTNGNYSYGWKTTTNVLNDTSVHAFWLGTPPTANPGWTPTVYQPPAGGPVKPLDLAFKLTMCGPVTIYRLAPTNVVVTWRGGGYLQSSTNVIGPYADVSGATSPYTNTTVAPPYKFYRLRCY